jgi:hypothetical protein
MPDPSKQFTLDIVATAYIASRDKISELNSEIDKIKATQAKREAWFQAELTKQGLQSAKTSVGTIYQALKESVTVSDWETFLTWVKENDSFEYLNHAVGKVAALEKMGEKRDQPPPPGISYTATRTCQIRKS